MIFVAFKAIWSYELVRTNKPVISRQTSTNLGNFTIAPIRNDSHDRASELQRGMVEITVINELAFPTFRRYPP